MFATKPQLAGGLLDRAQSLGIRAAFVAGDEVYGGRQLRRDIRQRGMGYVMAVRANHTVITGSGRTVTAAAAASMIPAHAWHRMRTGSGTKGTRHYDWAMLEVTSDDTPDGGRRRAQRPADPPAPLYRHTVVLPVLDTRTGPAVPADRHRGQPLANRGRSSARQAEHRPGRRAGHPLEILAPLDRALPARIHLPRRRRSSATPARGPLRPGHRADPGHRPGAAAAPARHRHPAAAARPGPPAALVGLAAPPPAPRPPSPPTLERLRRDSTMITTNYSCRISALLKIPLELPLARRHKPPGAAAPAAPSAAKMAATSPSARWARRKARPAAPSASIEAAWARSTCASARRTRAPGARAVTAAWTRCRGTEHPHHRASTRTGRLAGAPADYHAGGAEQDCPVGSSRQRECPGRRITFACPALRRPHRREPRCRPTEPDSRARPDIVDAAAGARPCRDPGGCYADGGMVWVTHPFDPAKIDAFVRFGRRWSSWSISWQHARLLPAGRGKR